jgi:hypothetical protein
LKTEERLPDESAIGVLGDPRWQFWPQALHWRIAAVVPRKQIPEFLSLPSLEQHRILRMFELAGAKIVIAELNQATAPDGCKRIGQMPYCIFDLSDSNGH